MQHLRTVQKRELELLLFEAGLKADDWQWETSLPGAERGSSLEQPDVVRELATQAYFAIGHPDLSTPQKQVPRFCQIAPAGLELVVREAAGGWDKIVARFKSWLNDVLRERRRPLLWPPDSQAAEAKNLLVSQLNDIYDVIESSQLPIKGFQWLNGTDVQWRGSGYSFSINRSGVGAFSGTFSPAKTTRRGRYEQRSWNGVLDSLRNWLVELARDLDAENNPLWGKTLVPVPGSYRLQSLEIKNVRGFRDFRLSCEQPPNKLVIFGENGSGKSTLLRCLALALASPAEATSLLSTVPGGLLGEASEVGTIRLTIVDHEGVPHEQTATIRRGFGEAVELEKENFPFQQAIAYGSARGLVGATERKAGHGPLSSLFAPDAALLSPELTMRRVRDRGEAVFHAFASSLQRVLQLPEDTSIVLDDELLVQEGKRRFPFQAWADGYRLFSSLLTDIAAWSWELRSTMPSDMGCLVLIDEVEQHLHPRLQLRLMKSLCEAYPRACLIATSHSPLVLLGMEPHEVVVLEVGEGGEVRRKETPDFRTFSVLEVLDSQLFFDAPVLSLHLLELQADHRRLLAKKRCGSLTDDDRKSLQDIAQKLELVVESGKSSTNGI